MTVLIGLFLIFKRIFLFTLCMVLKFILYFFLFVMSLVMCLGMVAFNIWFVISVVWCLLVWILVGDMFNILVNIGLCTGIGFGLFILNAFAGTITSVLVELQDALTIGDKLLPLGVEIDCYKAKLNKRISKPEY